MPEKAERERQYSTAWGDVLHIGAADMARELPGLEPINPRWTAYWCRPPAWPIPGTWSLSPCSARVHGASGSSVWWPSTGERKAPENGRWRGNGHHLQHPQKNWVGSPVDAQRFSDPKARSRKSKHCVLKWTMPSARQPDQPWRHSLPRLRCWPALFRCRVRIVGAGPGRWGPGRGWAGAGPGGGGAGGAAGRGGGGGPPPRTMRL